MYPKVIPGPSSDALNGLNWQVQVEPLSLSITSLPPTVPPPEPDGVVDAAVDDPVDVPVDLDFEPPPQAAASMHVATSATSHAKPFNGSLFITHLSSQRRSGRSLIGIDPADQFGKPLNKSEYISGSRAGQPVSARRAAFPNCGEVRNGPG